MQLAIAVEDLLARDGSNTVAWNHDADQVDGVGASYRNNCGAVAVAGGAERVDCLREGELLAAEAGDEAATANLAASFEATENTEEIAPPGGVGLTGEQVAEENAVTGEEQAGG